MPNGKQFEVISPDGQEGYIPAEDWPLASKSGYKLIGSKQIKPSKPATALDMAGMLTKNATGYNLVDMMGGAGGQVLDVVKAIPSLLNPAPQTANEEKAVANSYDPLSYSANLSGERLIVNPTRQSFNASREFADKGMPVESTLAAINTVAGPFGAPATQRLIRGAEGESVEEAVGRGGIDSLLMAFGGRAAKPVGDAYSAVRNKLGGINPEAQAENLAATLKPKPGVDAYNDVAKPTLSSLQETAKRMGVDFDKLPARETPFKLVEVVNENIRKLDGEFQAAYQPIKGTTMAPAASQRVATAYSSLLNKVNKSIHPELYASIEAGALRLKNGLKTLEDFNREREFLNKELDSFYSKETNAQAASSTELRAMRKAASELRSVVYDEIQAQTGQNVRPLMQLEGAMIDARGMAQRAATQMSNKQSQFASTDMLERFRQGSDLGNSVKQSLIRLSPADLTKNRLMRAFRERYGASTGVPDTALAPLVLSEE